MSILINTEMPTSCFECKLLDYTDTFRCRFRFESLAREHGINISRPSWCPLVPVPPHGRLIDADAVMNSVTDEKGAYVSQFAAVIGEAVDAAPTIIQEEGET